MCCSCEIRQATFRFREGTNQERGCCDYCLAHKFEDLIDKFLIYVYGSTHGAIAHVPAPEPPKAVPDGEIRISLFTPSVAGIYRIIVSEPGVLASESYDLLVTP